MPPSNASTTDLPEWCTPEHWPVLGTGEVHLWRLPLQLSPSLLEPLQGVLSPDEHARYNRLRSPQQRRRFVIGRAGLRCLLSGYVSCPPSELRFEYGPHGKPLLAVGQAAAPAFNLSHAGDLALVGFGDMRCVGVDVERFRADLAGGAIAQRFFHPDEARYLQSLPSQQRQDAFFNLWCGKEAYIKANGWAIATAMAKFALRPADSGDRCLFMVDGQNTAGDRWYIRSLSPQAGHLAAIAAPRPPTRIRYLNWPRNAWLPSGRAFDRNWRKM
jgi:4'-phosphopantetheinyl transferase